MTLRVAVVGGTNAGWKQPPVERRWIHICAARRDTGGVELASYSCPDCGTRRPNIREHREHSG